MTEEYRAQREILKRLLRNVDGQMPVEWLPNLDVSVISASRLPDVSAVALAFPSHVIELLTPRQFQVANLVADGLPDKMIATHLNIHESTVRAHLKESEKRLGVETRAQLALQVAILRLVRVVQRQSRTKEREKEKKKERSKPDVRGKSEDSR